MILRTSHTTMTFTHPFELDGFTEPQPAGEYRVEVDEEVIEGGSFLAYRRVAAMLYCRPSRRRKDASRSSAWRHRSSMRCWNMIGASRADDVDAYPPVPQIYRVGLSP